MAKYKRNIFKRYKKNIGELVKTYPHLFNKRLPLPLAIGILEQLANDGLSGLSKTEIRDCLAVWTKRREYVKQCRRADAVRFNLNGTPSEPVSKEHKARAKIMYAMKKYKIRESHREKKAKQLEDDHPDF